MKVMISRQDNEDALDQAYQELMELMDGRAAEGAKGRLAPKPSPAEAQLHDEEGQDENDPGEKNEPEAELSDQELQAILARLKG
jgi:hypothetical protein